MSEVIIPPDFTVTGFVVDNNDFSTLRTAVTTANLAGTLDGMSVN